MIINRITRNEFLEMFRDDRAGFMARIHKPEGFVVKQFYDGKFVLDLRARLYSQGLESEPSWHPLKDECPDYHRVHDNYKGAYVKSKMHAFYLHGWYEHNRQIFSAFREIFSIKNALGGYPENAFITNKPSEGIVARVLVHHYPSGGGYQEEHIDPVADFAKLQTIVAASQYGTDFRVGGLYAKERSDGDRYYVDPFAEPGDLILLSPGIHHGVAPVDPIEPYDWRRAAGRWIIMPIVLHSDYAGTSVTRPRGVASADAAGA
jgi:hypothetical protein